MDGFSIGDTIPLSVTPADEFTVVTAQIRRRSSGQLLDFADNTFKASPGMPTVTLTAQGEEFLYLWNSTGLSDGSPLTGKQNLAVEFTIDGEQIAEDLNLGYGGGGGIAGADVVDGTVTVMQALRALLAFVAGKTGPGDASPLAFYRQDGTTAALTFTVDENGTRSVVVKDLG